MRPISIYNGKVKHIDDPTGKGSGITGSERHEMGYKRSGRIIENQPVKNTVYNIPHSPGQHQRQTNDISGRYPFSDDFNQIIRNKSYGNNTKGSEKKLIKKLPAKSHPRILGKQDVKPVRDTNALMHMHPRLHSDLYGLVDHQYQQDNTHRPPALGWHRLTFSHFRSHLFFHIFGFNAQRSVRHHT